VEENTFANSAIKLMKVLNIKANKSTVFLLVPDYYFSPLDINGRRIDQGTRAELVYGTVEFTVKNPVFDFSLTICFHS